MSEFSRLQGIAAVNVLCGELLGEGISRKVFACKLDPSLVVKVEMPGESDEYRNFANAYEYRNWHENSDYRPVADWLAPCVSLSPCGLILLQKRVEPLRDSELPEKVPDFLTDLKKANFGLYEGRVVCCDYSTLITRVSKSLKKADWW